MPKIAQNQATMNVNATVLSILALIRLSNGAQNHNDGTSTMACVYDLTFKNKSVLKTNEYFQSPDDLNLYVVQRDNGNLLVKEGDKTLWESGKSEPSGDYWTQLQDDGYIVTYRGTSTKKDELIWTSSSTGSEASKPYWIWKPDANGDSENTPPVWRADGDSPPVWTSSTKQRSSKPYFMGLDCDRRYVAIYEGSPENPGDWIWRERALDVSQQEDALGASSKGAVVVPFAFYVMGDVPYAPWEEDELKDQIDYMKNYLHPGASFTVHLGDMQRGSETGCPLSQLEKVYNILWNGPLPTFVLAGDNDVLECNDEEDAWENYFDTFVDFEQEWRGSLPSGAREFDVYRWDQEREVEGYGDIVRRDMFAFFEDGILFTSMALLNVKRGKPDDAFYERLAVSYSWVEKNLQKYKNEGLRGVVLFSHAEESDDLEGFFGYDLQDLFYYEDVYVPVLYICGDAHKWNIHSGMFDWDEFTYIQVDNGACADPLIIEVAPLINGGTQPFDSSDSSSSQYLAGDGLFRIDRQYGRYEYKECR